MSIKLMAAAWDMDIPATEKMVLLALCDHANDDGTCWPSRNRLAQKCSVSVPTVKRAIKKLEERGFISRDKRLHETWVCHISLTAQSEPSEGSNTTVRGFTVNPEPSRTTNTSIKRALPANWWPEDFGEGTESSTIVAGWDEKTMRRHVEQFAAHHSAVGSKYTNWQAAWSKWVLNTEKFKPRPPPETRGGSLADIGDEVRRLYGI